MTPEETLEFTRHHVEVWNNHDLEAILGLYSDDVQLLSPLAQSMQGGAGIRGKAELRAYFSAALEKFPDLHFTLLDTLYGANSVTIYFKSISDRLVADLLFLDEESPRRRRGLASLVPGPATHPPKLKWRASALFKRASRGALHQCW